jgi:hypothetical protein
VPLTIKQDPAQKPDPIQRVQDLYRKLIAVSTELNGESDRLGAAIDKFDASLRKLGLGITSWVVFRSGGSEDGFYYSVEEIGYAKIGKEWGLAIQTRSGNESDDSDDVDGCWSFNDAPRELRVRAVGKIPDLLEKLIKDAADIAKQVSQQVEVVDGLTAAIKNLPATGESTIVPAQGPKATQ